MSLDRLAAATKGLQAFDPLWPYRRLYRAKIVNQNAGTLGLVDVRPDDPTLPDMAGIPLRHGMPGLSVQVSPGAWLAVGWEDGDPTKPFAALWADGASVSKVILDSSLIQLGGAGASQAMVLGNSWQTVFNTLMDLCSAALGGCTPSSPAGATAIAAFATGVSAAKSAQYLSGTVKTE